MQLTDAQLRAAESGQVVELTDDGRGFVLLSREVYEQVRQLDNGDLVSPGVTARLIRETMAEEDADDPTLASYQKYKRHP